MVVFSINPVSRDAYCPHRDRNEDAQPNPTLFNRKMSTDIE
jgi:hypothetical protein